MWVFLSVCVILDTLANNNNYKLFKIIEIMFTRQARPQVLEVEFFFLLDNLFYLLISKYSFRTREFMYKTEHKWFCMYFVSNFVPQ